MDNPEEKEKGLYAVITEMLILCFCDGGNH